MVSYILECIPEADIQIYRVHRESDRMEVILEDIVESPSKVGVYVEMFERSPSGSCLKPPLKTSQIVGEVISCDFIIGKFYFRSCWIVFTQISFVYVSLKVYKKNKGLLSHSNGYSTYK